MAKPPNQASRHDQRKADPTKDQDQDKEEEGAEKEGPESEHNKAQNTVGNAALAAQMANSAPDDGGGGGGGGLSMRKAGQDEDKDYGGDGTVDDDVPLTLEDLTRSWNPGTHKTQDRPSWLEPMPSDELPPEDPAFLAEVRTGQPKMRVEATFTLDSLLQPSTTVVAASVLDWTRGVKKFASSELVDRAVTHALVPPAPFLQDPHGRVLIARARAAAIALWLAQRSPALSGSPPTADVACVGFLLELHGHRRHQEAVRIAPGVESKQMPRAVTVFKHSYEGRNGRLVPRDLPPSAAARVHDMLRELVDIEDPHVYIPSLIPDEDGPVDEDDLDPLGLDAILIELTGGKADLEAPMFYAAIQAAEKLAAATARFRVNIASTAVAVAQVAGLWSAGAPVEALLHALDVADQQSDKNLKLLVEVARAAQKRAVPPKGLKAGLKRAAKALQGVHGVAIGMLGSVVGGILPGVPSLPAADRPVFDAVEDAWLDGRPDHALPWLDGLPGTPENEATSLIVRAAAGTSPSTLGPAFLALADRQTDPAVAGMLRVMAGPCLLAAGDLPGALAASGDEMIVGARRRNGILLANGALLGMEALQQAGRVDEARALRLEAGRLAWRMGAPAALTLLARWAPATPDASDA